jgi:predicted transcriptional regulator
MTVLSDQRAVLCHECGVPTCHAGLHARRVHGLSPDQYRSKFGIANRVPLCSPSYSEGRRRSARRTGTAQNVLPYRWRRRLPTRVEARQLASFDFNVRR